MTGPGRPTFSPKGTLAGGLETIVRASRPTICGRLRRHGPRLADGAATAKGKVRLEAADIEPWLMTTGVGLPGMGMGMPVVADGRASTTPRSAGARRVQRRDRRGPGRRRRQCRRQGRHAASDRRTWRSTRSTSSRSRPWCSATSRARRRRGRLADRAVPAEGRGAVHRRSRPCRRDARRRHRSATAYDAALTLQARQGGPAACPTSAASSTAATLTGLFEAEEQ